MKLLIKKEYFIGTSYMDICNCPAHKAICHKFDLNPINIRVGCGYFRDINTHEYIATWSNEEDMRILKNYDISIEKRKGININIELTEYGLSLINKQLV